MAASYENECPVCFNNSTNYYDFDNPIFNTKIDNIENICPVCIYVVIWKYYSLIPTEPDLIFMNYKLVMTSKGITEKLEKTCKNTMLLVMVLNNRDFRLAEFLIEHCNININTCFYNDAVVCYLIYYSSSIINCWKSKKECIKFLLKWGADTEFKDINGNTYNYYLTDKEKIEIQEYIDNKLYAGNIKPVRK
jgi:hypothetical protein